MEPGDIAITGVKSLDPDAIYLLALADLPGGASIYISDNAWTGSSLKTNEGVMKVSNNILISFLLLEVVLMSSSPGLGCDFIAGNTNRGYCERF